jgi:ATP-dependent Zn protease
MSGAKELKVEHIRKVYKKNFDIYQKTPINQKRATAYHEAGHFAAWYLSKTKINEECILISIVPAEDWLGVNFFEESEIQFHKRDMNYLKESVSINLAGRVAQSFVSKEIDAGASSDLEHATTEVENFIMKCGMNGDYLNYSFDSKSELSVSDNTSDDIRKKAKEFINETYKYTEELLSKNKASIDNVAKLLMKKGIITKEEAINAFKEGKVVTKRNSKKTKAKVAEVK